MSIFQRSAGGSPPTIHSAMTWPLPPAPAMPWAQKPAATKKPATSLSPRMNSPSGVNASGPLMSCVTSASARQGTSVVAASLRGRKRSQSGGRSVLLKVGGMAPSTLHGSGSRS